MFSEFEDYAHKLVENNKPISVEILNNKYKNLLEKHFGNSVIIDDKIYPSITNFGNQPTVDGENKVLETHIKGFSGNLYGKFITVYFVEYLRDIQKFTSIEKLKEQLIKDLGSI